jgi:hypothetical protein
MPTPLRVRAVGVITFLEFIDDGLPDPLQHLRTITEHLDGFLLTLRQALPIEAVPRPTLLDHIHIASDVDQVPHTIDPTTEHDLYFRLTERRRYFVLRDLHPNTIPDLVRTALDVPTPTHFDAYGAVELQGATPGRGLGIAVQHPDLLTDLVDEDGGGLTLGEHPRELAEGLAHQAGLESDVGVTHVAFDFGSGYECGDAIDDDDVDGATSDEEFGDLEGLFAGVGLADEEVVGVDAEVVGVGGVEGVFGVDEGGDASSFLGFSDDVEAEGGMPRARSTLRLPVLMLP